MNYFVHSLIEVFGHDFVYDKFSVLFIGGVYGKKNLTNVKFCN